MEYYDITGDAWNSVANMPVLRNFFAFENGLNGQLYLMGGIDSGGINHLEAWSYDIQGNFWTQITSINNINSRIGTKKIIYLKIFVEFHLITYYYV